ncbi:hypothetical protein [Moorena producens]|uniref:hypothetical protein n=1 Tax=Moorena producens TaxID=1155739 RepID=UPI0013144D03|nr:hypothetical protein [Moorena producens]
MGETTAVAGGTAVAHGFGSVCGHRFRTCLDAVAHGGNPLWRRCIVVSPVETPFGGAASPRPHCLPKTALPPQDRAAPLLPAPCSQIRCSLCYIGCLIKAPYYL